MNVEINDWAGFTYHELRRLASAYLRSERTSHTLQPTALVHEAYIKLALQHHAVWQNKRQFLAIAAQCMRRILVDHARHRARQKRGGTSQPISLDEISVVLAEQSFDLVLLDEALDRLTQIDPRQSEVVKLRFFGGLSIDETANCLNISPKTVKRDWIVAKAWLYAELKEKSDDEAGAMGTPQESV